MAEEKGEYNFTEFGGKANQASCGGSDYIVYQTSDGKIFKRSANSDAERISGSAKSVTVGDDGVIWCCDESMEIHRRTWDGEFEKMKGLCVQIDCGNDEHVACVNEKQKMYVWEPAKKAWKMLPGKGVSIAIGSEGEMWCVNEEEQIYRFDADHDKWTNVPGRAKEIAVGDCGTVFAIAKNGKIYQWDGRGWYQIEGVKCKQLTAGTDGTVIIVQPNNRMQIHTAHSGWQTLKGNPWKHIRVGAVDKMIALTDVSKMNVWKYDGDDWEHLTGTLTCADIGDDGELWGCNKDDVIYRHNGVKWEKMRGKLAKISVGNKENIAGVNKDGFIYRWTGSKWEKIGEGYQDISMGVDGSLYAVDNNNHIVRRADDDSGWVGMKGYGTHVSVGDEDNVVMTNSEGDAFELLNGKWSKVNHGRNHHNNLFCASDGTIVKLVGEQGWILHAGGDDENESDTDEDPEPPKDGEGDMGGMESDDAMNKPVIKRRPSANPAARRRAVIRRQQREHHRRKRREGKPVVVVVTRPGYTSRGVRRKQKKQKRARR